MRARCRPRLPDPELTRGATLPAKLLAPLLTAPASAGEKKVEVEILTRSKDDAENKKLFGRILEIIGSGVRVSCCLDQVERNGT